MVAYEDLPMTRIAALRGPLHLLALSALILAGCETPPPSSKPVTATKPPAQKSAPPSDAASIAEVSLFGDHPDAERVPYENRLLTNMARHTFSSVGRDFDPDLHSDGQTLVFASTRNSEHPDIFLKTVNSFAVTQLTADPADDIQPRFSPDGEQVVFCSNRGGNWDIWLVSRDGTGLTQLTHDRSDEVGPCWSPDGQQVAFTAWGRRSHQWEVWLLSIDRPGIRRFLCYGMFPDWSPDGKRIAFQRARQRGTRWFSVWALELVDGEARHPTELAYSDSAACISPRWSPDGNTIAYCGVRRQAAPSSRAETVPADIWIVDVESGTRLKLTDGAVSAFNPTWGDAESIYFVSARAGVENIWSLSTDLEGYPSEQHATRSATLSGPAVNAPIETDSK
jgi:TolB protein